MKNLISNTAFGKHLDTLELSLSAYKQIRQKFDSFLSMNLEIWQFVAAKKIDGVWVVLEEPILCAECLDSHELICAWHKEELKEYQQAKERCLFEGFTKTDWTSMSGYEISNGEIQICVYKEKPNYFIWNYKTIEDLVKHKPFLTYTVQKQLEL